jgi:hypothetical protein
MPIGATVLPEAVLLAAKTIRLQLTIQLLSVLISAGCGTRRSAEDVVDRQITLGA